MLRWAFPVGDHREHSKTDGIRFKTQVTHVVAEVRSAAHSAT